MPAEPFDAILPPNGAYPALALPLSPSTREKLFYRVWPSA